MNCYRILILSLLVTVHCTTKEAKKIFFDPGIVLGSALFKVFWSDPGTSRETAIDKGIDQEWVQFINNAKSTLDLACYNLGRQVVIDAIINARQRGVKVRLVGDVDESVTSGYQAMFRTDIPFAVGNSTGIQHNKFAIADGTLLIMGTGNLTDTDLIMNNNNYMIIESKSLADAYTKEFEQMFFGKFAGKKSPRTLDKRHRVNLTDIELYFSPYDGDEAMNRLIQFVNEAKSEINYMIFAHTHDELTTALIRAAKRGVLVRGIHDYTFVRGTSMEAARLYNAGRLNPNGKGPFNKEDGNENTKTPGRRESGGKLHCKTMIIDGRIVSTGSFNWSNNAVNNNDENMMVIYSPQVAAELQNQWNSIWNYGRPITNQIEFPSGDSVNYGDVVISEILWAGSFASGSTSSSPTKDDVWIELYNTTDKDIDISHWVLTWDPEEIAHYAIPDRFSWFEAGVHKIHRSEGRLVIPARGYFLLKNTNDSLPTLTETNFDNDASDNKISGTKNFSLSPAFLRLRLYDTAMNLIDEAGDGSPPVAGIVDGANSRTHSMERFFQNGKALNGRNAGSWYSSNGNNALATTLDPLKGTGRLTEDYRACTSGKGCTIGTPNARINSPYASSASNPRGGILGLTNVPISANAISSSTVSIQMRWAIVTAPTVTGATNVRIDPTDSSKLLVDFPNSSGVIYSITVNNSGLDITNSLVDGGVVSFYGYTTTKAKVYISAVYPGESSSNGDKIELTAESSGSLKDLGIYYYDSSTLNIPYLVYRMGSVDIVTGQKILVTMNKGTTLSDDKRIGENPSININANSTNTWDVFSSASGLPSTDAIIFASFDTTKTPEDLMCYSNQDGSIAEDLMKWGFRYVYRNSSVYNLDSIYPVFSVNDFEIQKRCSPYVNGGSGKFLSRVARKKIASDFICVNCD
ncbi:MAG: phospholipase D-like domain-containing protein [Leptospiraceae bacterium]|nr:phospholipase D-like domain-containing protein [Leptospiraceae bacterium]